MRPLARPRDDGKCLGLSWGRGSAGHPRWAGRSSDVVLCERQPPHYHEIISLDKCGRRAAVPPTESGMPRNAQFRCFFERVPLTSTWGRPPPPLLPLGGLGGTMQRAATPNLRGAAGAGIRPTPSPARCRNRPPSQHNGGRPAPQSPGIALRGATVNREGAALGNASQWSIKSFTFSRSCSRCVSVASVARFPGRGMPIETSLA